VSKMITRALSERAVPSKVSDSIVLVLKPLA
jgi:hypothetical protein